MATRKKYTDTPRYPKIQTNGFEKEFKDNYQFTVQSMVREIGKQILNLTKK